MTDVGTLKQEVVITNLGNAILLCTTVNNHVLADNIVITNLYVRLSTAEVKILRQGCNHTSLMNLVVIADARAVADADEWEDDTVITYHHIVLDIHKGEYLTVVANLGLWANLGFWTYFVHIIHNLKIKQFKNVTIRFYHFCILTFFNFYIFNWRRHRELGRDLLRPAFLRAGR
jgi:hypothetical protein